ncbi:hypothetical protein COLU111180_09605 [Cohnella lubricantis]|uniref:Uncharacterized protein n=1 Tax=Cohnella lubricantis TaxID=2163172 RepID=A0A841TEE6_9BACL|nr:hypothetical protein [Cohnella lubricantis]MBB6678435.1 hypothetical protein [Cohnella lubricantis]MBP2116815.1 hypothetical protein [Cohnella lubricantis]
MSDRFGFGRRARTEKLLSDIRARLEEMETRFRRFEESLERSEGGQPQQPHVQIENVHIHQPVLEKLEFRLDALDIEQLSGSLNLGNNFGAKWAGIRETDSGTAAGKKANGAAAGTNAGSAAGAAAGLKSDARKMTSGASGANRSGAHSADGVSGTDAGDGLRRTPSGYCWNNRR